MMTDTTNASTASTAADLKAASGNILNAFRTKSFEKALLYCVGVIGATNVFGTTSLGTDLRSILVLAPAFIIGLIHNSTPVTPVK